MKKYFTNTFWRWHFYAGLLITPFLLMLSISGMLYLFYPEVETAVNHDALLGQTGKSAQSLQQGIDDILAENPGWHVMTVSFLKGDYNTRVSLMGPNDQDKVVYLDHHHHIQASMNPADLFSNWTRTLHSSLLTNNTWINYLIEIVACWMIFLIITGVILTLTKRYFSTKKATVQRHQRARLHAVLGTVMAAPLLILVLTGLPWSGFIGGKIYDYAMHHEIAGFPHAVGNPPTSNNEIPWATRQEKTMSTSSGVPLEIKDVVDIAQDNHFTKPYSITAPMDRKGTYVITKSSGSGVTGLDVSPFDERTIHIDQYSGMKLAIYDYQDYGWLGKLITIGIPLHEGHLFGWVNKAINLIVAGSIVVLAIYGLWIYLMRKLPGKLSAPKAQPYSSYTLVFLAVLIVLGVLLPLFGLTLLMIAVIECFVWLLNKRTKRRQPL